MIDENVIERNFEALGTYNFIRIYEDHRDELLEQAVTRVMEIHNLLSAYRPDSEVSRINQNAGRMVTPVSQETLRLLAIAHSFSELSEGAFDITVRPLINLWGIGKKDRFVPSPQEIRLTKELINYKDVLINDKNSSVILAKPGQAIDLGGIAKGFAADEVKRLLMEAGIQSALINLGGNVITIGMRPDHTPWRIGIQNPREVTGTYLGMVAIEDKTVVTSGVNERYFIKEGLRYHHILDPRTGEPARSGLLSVTAICESSVLADALTTALFILGMEQGLSLLSSVGAEAIFVTEDNKIYSTGGLRENFTMV